MTDDTILGSVTFGPARQGVTIPTPPEPFTHVAIMMPGACAEEILEARAVADRWIKDGGPLVIGGPEGVSVKFGYLSPSATVSVES